MLFAERMSELQRWIDSVRSLKSELALTTGCFDLFHAGHVDLLYMAKRLQLRDGIDRKVIVCVDSDKRVAFLKGHGRPIMSFAERRAVLESCRWVDRVEHFDSLKQLCEISRIVSPDLIVKNENDSREFPGYRPNHDRIMKVPTAGIHTSDIIQRILDSQG